MALYCAKTSPLHQIPTASEGSKHNTFYNNLQALKSAANEHIAISQNVPCLSWLTQYKWQLAAITFLSWNYLLDLNQSSFKRHQTPKTALWSVTDTLRAARAGVQSSVLICWTYQLPWYVHKVHSWIGTYQTAPSLKHHGKDKQPSPITFPKQYTGLPLFWLSVHISSYNTAQGKYVNITVITTRWPNPTDKNHMDERTTATTKSIH